MADQSGFNYPIDVYFGDVYLGTLVVKPAGYEIKLVDTPSGKKAPNPGGQNFFRGKKTAVQVLHRMWEKLWGDEGDDGEDDRSTWGKPSPFVPTI